MDSLKTRSEASSPERSPNTDPKHAGLQSEPIATESPAESPVGEWLAGVVIVLAWAAVVIVQALAR